MKTDAPNYIRAVIEFLTVYTLFTFSSGSIFNELQGRNIKLITEKTVVLHSTPLILKTGSEKFGEINPSYRYKLSFSARASTQLNSYIGVFFKRIFSPHLTEPSPGFVNFKVNKEWQFYSLEFKPEQDFFTVWKSFPDISFYFFPGSSLNDTLWIKDLQLSEDTTFQYNYSFLSNKLPFIRLTPADDGKVDIEIYPDSILDTSNLRILGVALPSTRYPKTLFDKRDSLTLSPQIIKRIQRLNISFTRIFVPIKDTLDIKKMAWRLKQIITALGIPPEWVVLELEPGAPPQSLSPTLWAKAVDYLITNVDPGLRFWEIGNEPYIIKNKDFKRISYPSAHEYAQHVNRVSRAIKEIQPHAKIGISLSQNYLTWSNTVLRESRGHYDFVAPHYYTGLPVRQFSFEDIVLGENALSLIKTMSISHLVAINNPDDIILHLVTEWGKNARSPTEKWPAFVPQNGNIMGVLHRAVRMIYYLREKMVDACAAWQLLGEYNIRGKKATGFYYFYIDQPVKQTLLFLMHSLFREHVGKYLVKFQGRVPFYRSRKISSSLVDLSMPYTPFLATVNSTRDSIYLIIVNASYSKSFETTVKIVSQKKFEWNAELLTDPRSNPVDRDGLTTDPGDFIKGFQLKVQNDVLLFEIPPHSILFVKGGERF